MVSREGVCVQCIRAGPDPARMPPRACNLPPAARVGTATAPHSMTPDALVRLHADLAYRVALRVTGTPDDAADATQAALVAVWQRGADVPADRQRAWVSRVARNAALDLVRRRRVRPQPFAADVDLEPVSPAPLPDALAEAGDLRREIGDALDALGEPFRSLVVLRDVEGLSYDEIADALSLPLTTVKVYLHRARTRLRTALHQSVPNLVPCP